MTLRCREIIPREPFSRLGPMPRMPRSPLAFALAAVAALALVACGEEDAELLPGETAREITANLDTVKQLADEGDCVGAESAVEQVGEQVEAVQGVDPKLKRALEEGSARLEEVIAECEEAELEAIEPAIVPTQPEDEEEEEKEPREKGGKGKQPQAGEGPDTPSASPELPPQANGEGKGLEDDDGEPPPSEEEGGGEEPSGGISPSAPAGEGE